MNDKLEALKGKNHEALENHLGFTHYLETKDLEDFKKINVDHLDLVNAFLKFNKRTALSTVQFQDGIIQDFLSLGLDEIEKELKSLKNNKGEFSSPDDEELTTSFGFFTNEYLAEFMRGIIFFSGKEDAVERFSSVLHEFRVKHFPPKLIPSLQRANIRYYKLGRNEPCHCESGVKYKKCCLEKDIKEMGGVKKVAYND